MNKPNRQSHELMNILNNSITDLPSPSNITTWWNMGSLLGLCILIQSLTGILLAMHYHPDSQMAFMSITHIMNEVNSGWVLRYTHANGASLLFICIYLHVGRSLYYGSFKTHNTWNSGTLILFLLMMIAFLGYILPWGQMSFWGATVITNLLSTIPYIGNSLIYWLWGGYAIESPTLTRFFTLHFLLPFIVMGMVLMHLSFLHLSGSNNPIGLNSNLDKIPFHPFYSTSDILGFSAILMIIMYMILVSPITFNDPDNFIPANPLVTPTHIQPEWYFLFAYSILRAIPNKLGGVIALMGSIAILLTMPLSSKSKFKSKQFCPPNQLLFWMFTTNLILLTWIGSNPVEPPFILMGQVLAFNHFSYFALSPIITQWWDSLLN
uniref:Cytochrome b n=1 Tax=Xenophyes cascus TaxID=984453 RepID=L7NAZ8_9HEMI|nr:cytochrome b [Xenophyes cascus]